MLEATSKEEPKVYIDLDGRWWCFILSLSTLILGSPLYASSRPGAVDERQLWLNDARDEPRATTTTNRPQKWDGVAQRKEEEEDKSTARFVSPDRRRPIEDRLW